MMFNNSTYYYIIIIIIRYVLYYTGKGIKMTDKEVRRLSRAQLLEILVAQGKEIEELKAELAATRKKLEDRTIEIEKSGSLAEAALRLNGVFEAAEEAAKQYLENIRRLSGEQEQVCARMEAESKKKARAMLLKAEERCRAREREADAYWDSMSEKLQKFYDDHEGLYQMLQHSMRKPEEKSTK